MTIEPVFLRQAVLYLALLSATCARREVLADWWCGCDFRRASMGSEPVCHVIQKHALAR